MRLFVLTCLFLGFVAPVPTSAQTGLATVTGIVTDNSGSAVPGATVTATNQATNVAYTGVTNDAGVYIITAVPIGAYVVAASCRASRPCSRPSRCRPARRPASTSGSRSAPSRSGSR